jgi:hypothetical protein
VITFGSPTSDRTTNTIGAMYQVRCTGRFYQADSLAPLLPRRNERQGLRDFEHRPVR